jgi:hypothetical protein
VSSQEQQRRPPDDQGGASRRGRGGSRPGAWIPHVRPVLCGISPCSPHTSRRLGRQMGSAGRGELTARARPGSPHSVLSSRRLCRRPRLSTPRSSTSTPTTHGFIGFGYLRIAALITVSHGWLAGEAQSAVGGSLGGGQRATEDRQCWEAPWSLGSPSKPTPAPVPREQKPLGRAPGQRPHPPPPHCTSPSPELPLDSLCARPSCQKYRGPWLCVGPVGLLDPRTSRSSLMLLQNCIPTLCACSQASAPAALGCAVNLPRGI